MTYYVGCDSRYKFLDRDSWYIREPGVRPSGSGLSVGCLTPVQTVVRLHRVDVQRSARGIEQYMVAPMAIAPCVTSVLHSLPTLAVHTTFNRTWGACD